MEFLSDRQLGNSFGGFGGQATGEDNWSFRELATGQDIWKFSRTGYRGGNLNILEGRLLVRTLLGV